MKTEYISAERPIAISHAADVLLHGGLVAFPTDTVYGLAAYPFQAESVERLFVAKGRDNQRAIAILVGDPAHLKLVATEMGPMATALAHRFWPGPLTLIVPRHPALPGVLSPLDTIGVRMPNHPVALGLLRKVGPLAVTSANLSGSSNALTAQEVRLQLGGRIHLILDGGKTPGGVPSTVVDCTGAQPTVLRQGPVSLEEISAALA